MKKNIIATCILAGLFSTAALAAPIVTVNGQAIDKSVVDTRVKNIVANSNGQAQDTPALRENVKNQLIQETLMEQEAKKRGLDRSSDYKTATETFQRGLLSELLINDVAKKNPVSDADVKKVYDQLATNTKGTKQIKLRQIITETESKAKQALTDLNKGQSFDAVARKYSDHASKENGGLIDSWENLTVLEKGASPVFNAINSLSKGAYTKEVVNLNGAYGLFKLEDKRDAVIPAYSEIKDQLKNDMLRQKVEQELGALREKATIK